MSRSPIFNLQSSVSSLQSSISNLQSPITPITNHQSPITNHQSPFIPPIPTLLNPPSLAKPSGYSHGVLVEGGRVLFLAGQTGMDATGRIAHPGDLVAQFEQALSNLKAVLEAAGGAMSDLVKLTIFVTDKQRYRENLKALGETYRSIVGKHYPAMTLVEVKSLFDDEAMVEVEGIAVIGHQSSVFSHP
ncbi:MAG: RidA family protein [Anaerolineales bacterium]|nr:RidA family protein [Anaerolineales bacterium]